MKKEIYEEEHVTVGGGNRATHVERGKKGTVEEKEKKWGPTINDIKKRNGKRLDELFLWHLLDHIVS